MLKATGIIGNREYKSTDIVDARVLAKEFGLPEYNDAGGWILELHPSRIGNSPLNGPRIPKSKTIPPVFTAVYKGASFTLRYFTSEVDKPNNMKAYSPGYVGFLGRARSISFAPSNYDLFVFMALTPSCATSPFAGKDSWWQLWSPEKVQADAAKSVAIRMDIITEITNPDFEDTLMIRAKGMTFQKQRLSKSQLSNPDVTRLQLMDWLQKDPVAFERAWNNGQNIFNGLVLECRDKRAIKKEISNGRQAWIWAAGAKKGSVITYISKTDDPDLVLIRALSSGGNYTENLAYMTDVINEVGAGEGGSESILSKQVVDDNEAIKALRSLQKSKGEKPAKKPAIADTPAVDFVSNAVAGEMLGVDRSTLEVFKIYNGEFIGDPIFVATDIQSWKTEFATFLDNNQGVREELNKFCKAAVNKA